MGVSELFLVAVGLSMDAFAVAICLGLSLKRAGMREAAIVGLWFGAFQALMPLAGYLLGSRFADMIADYDHWASFALLAFLGGKMIKDSFSGDEEAFGSTLELREMLSLSLATSIDAMAAGLSFAFLEVNIIPAVSFIGVVTFTLSAVGVRAGRLFGKARSRAGLIGGAILILMGVKIVLEHTGVL